MNYVFLILFGALKAVRLPEGCSNPGTGGLYLGQIMNHYGDIFGLWVSGRTNFNPSFPGELLAFYGCAKSSSCASVSTHMQLWTDEAHRAAIVAWNFLEHGSR